MTLTKIDMDRTVNESVLSKSGSVNSLFCSDEDVFINLPPLASLDGLLKTTRRLTFEDIARLQPDYLSKLTYAPAVHHNALELFTQAHSQPSVVVGHSFGATIVRGILEPSGLMEIYTPDEEMDAHLSQLIKLYASPSTTTNEKLGGQIVGFSASDQLISIWKDGISAYVGMHVHLSTTQKIEPQIDLNETGDDDLRLAFLEKFNNLLSTIGFRSAYGLEKDNIIAAGDRFNLSFQHAILDRFQIIPDQAGEFLRGLLDETREFIRVGGLLEGDWGRLELTSDILRIVPSSNLQAEILEEEDDICFE